MLGRCLIGNACRKCRLPAVAHSAPFARSRITASTSLAILRRSVASLVKSSRFRMSFASLPISSQSSASVSSFSSFVLRSSISQNH